MTAPTRDDVVAYLGKTGTVRDPDTVAAALASERAAQAARCRVPADDADWPADLAEALCRRVAVNLALRALPLAIQQTAGEIGGTSARVGGRDPEVVRLEAPHRRLVVG